MPAPISVSTNVIYFHFPSIGVDTAADTKNLEVKTAAAHYLSDGATLHEGNRLAHLRHRGEWGQGGFSEDFVLRAGTGPALEKGKSTSLRALIKPVGSGAVSWRVSGGWRTVGANLVAPARATTCVVTMRQAMTAKPKATSKTVHPVVS